MDSETLGLIFICKESIETHGVHAKIRIPIKSKIQPTESFVSPMEINCHEGFAAFILCDLIEPLLKYEEDLQKKLDDAKTKNIHWERIVRDWCPSYHGPWP